jgi:hypothetical protein
MAKIKIMCEQRTRKGTPCTRSASFLVDEKTPVCATHANALFASSARVTDLPAQDA